MQFEYLQTRLSDLVVKTTPTATSIRPTTHIIINDEAIEPSSRFWVSLYSRYGIAESIFRYFSYAEVFERIRDTVSSDLIRVCVERKDNKARLLGISTLNKPVIEYDAITQTLHKWKSRCMWYGDGIISSTHIPNVTCRATVNGEVYENVFDVAVPIDGYGGPSFNLGLMRTRDNCVITTRAPAFKTVLRIGLGHNTMVEVIDSVTRALLMFNNDEGFAALRSRLTSAVSSWASVRDVERLERAINASRLPRDKVTFEKDDPIYKLANGSDLETEAPRSILLRALNNLTGDPLRIYGLVTTKALSDKKKRTLPVSATVYAIIDFAASIMSKYVDTNGRARICSYIGDLISNEYDLEGVRHTNLGQLMGHEA